jgi:hypothetical protein
MGVVSAGFNVTTDPAVAYRTALTALDPVANPITVFTGATIPVVAVKGTPSVYVSARCATGANAIGVTPVAIGKVQQPGGSSAYAVLGVGAQITLTVGALTDGATVPKFLSPASLVDALGARGSNLLGGGPVEFIAFVVTTAPTGNNATDLYAWASA